MQIGIVERAAGDFETIRARHRRELAEPARWRAGGWRAVHAHGDFGAGGPSVVLRSVLLHLAVEPPHPDAVLLPEGALALVLDPRFLVDLPFRIEAHPSQTGSVVGWLDLETTEVAGATDALRERFERLAARWQRETARSSSVEDRVEHPAYREIISMGGEVVPLILQDLAKTPRMWGPALEAITGADPVLAEHAGKLDKIAEDWLQWGDRARVR